MTPTKSALHLKLMYTHIERRKGFYRSIKSEQNSAKREIDGKVLSWPMIKINRKKPRRGTSYGIKDIPGGLLASQQACGREIKGAPAK